jgi:tetratricopeptide (TPR) repeat protein
MPAMRFLVFASFLIPVVAACPTWAADNTSPSSIERIVEQPLGPLAPEDQRLDMLFARLKKERSPESARAIADEIREVFTISGSATVNMLMANADKALEEKRYGAALDFLDEVTLLNPDFAEGWNHRATAHYLMGNYPKAMADTARVLAIEPRHLGALSGLAGMLEESGRDRQALQAWDTYLDYYPADRDAQKSALDLIDKMAGSRT